MPIRIVVARGLKDKDTVYRLRHQVFIEEEQRFDHPEDRLFDRFDCLDETLNLLAYHGTTPVATMRLTLANPVGLPCSEFFDFGPAVKALDGGVAAIGWLCCLQQYRRHPGLIAGMFKLCVRKIRQGGNRHMISTVHPPVVPLLRNFGAKPVGEVFVAKGLNVPMQPVHCDFDRFPP